MKKTETVVGKEHEKKNEEVSQDMERERLYTLEGLFRLTFLVVSCIIWDNV